MQSVSSRIWTRVAVSISYDDNHYTTGTSNNGLCCIGGPSKSMKVKREEYLNLARKREKKLLNMWVTVIAIVISAFGRLRNGDGRVTNRKTRWNHTNYSSVQIGQNTKSPRDLLSLTQGKDHQLTLVRKTCKVNKYFFFHHTTPSSAANQGDNSFGSSRRYCHFCRYQAAFANGQDI